MPSALENLIKILKLEKQNGYNNKAVIGGLQAYAPNWADTARKEGQRPEQQALVEELLRVMADYETNENAQQRGVLAQYMLDRITRRAEPRPEYKVEIPQAVAQPQYQEPPSNLEDAFEPEEPAQRAPREERRRETPPSAPSQPAGKPRRRKRPPIDVAEAHKNLNQLGQPLTKISGVGEKMAEKLGNLGVSTLRELLYLFPRRYDDYTRMVPLNKMEPGKTYTIVGTIRRVFDRQTSGGRPILVVSIDDGTAQMDITFFNQPWLRRQLQVGMQLVFSGKTDIFLGRVTMSNPAWEPVDQKSLHTGGVVPIYPLTKGISARVMRRIMKTVVDDWADKLPDYLPDSVRDRADQVDLDWAIRQVHFPERWEYIAYARERLAFDELLFLQLGVMRNRTEWQALPAPPLDIPGDWLANFENALPFSLTGAQRLSIQTIHTDLAKNIPMNRLLQGDVGSGKTLVAAAALAGAALNGYQGALMAPTSILAEQHAQKIGALFRTVPGLENTRVALLTGSLSENERRAVHEGLADGSIGIVIGTQAIIQESVQFNNLAVAVIDEQHRFGVQQRGILRGKGTNPHILIMTATPIPRTLSLTMFADLDLTILDEMPPGRTPIQTRIVESNARARVYEFVEDMVLTKGHQAYIIYPLVEASDRTEASSAEEGYAFLQKNVFANYKVGMVHGRMRPAEKDAVMADFAQGDIQVLVSTAVIEVGVDVPNATAIIIENAERFGLAQLHQFRGRVGRGEAKSYCLLITDETTPRLEALEKTTDGFALAELDWQERGPGDLLGLRQSGAGQIQLAEQMDIRLVETAQQESRALYAEDPEFNMPEHALLAQYAANVRDHRTDIT
jgi:ATP-dependent DNA helicase RecG